jgi:hypothetical protein
MPAASATQIEHCPACGAAIERQWTHCWLCGNDFIRTPDGLKIAPGSETFQTAARRPLHSHSASFSLQSVMLVVTLAALVLGTFSVAPGLGIFLAIVSVPALIRTAIVLRKRESVGPPADAKGRALMFAASLAVVTLAGVAASIAFGIVCTASGLVALGASQTGPPEWVIAVPFLLGGAVGLYVFYRVMRTFSST